MDNGPLSYDALKSILKHMEANKRFEAVVKCPSIRNLEKLVPSKIDYLNFYTSYMVQVNDKCYNLGIIRKYREGNTPECFKRENEKGGIDKDLDQWGFKHEEYAYTRTPGDIEIGQVPPDKGVYPIDHRRDDSDRWYYEEQLRKLRNKENGDAECEKKRKEDIESFETELLPYLCRDDNMTLPYNSYIQLSNAHIQEYGWKYIPLEIVSYEKKLHEAMKYLLNFMFGGRSLIYVKSLEVVYSQLIRLPEGLKLNVRNLTGLQIDKQITQLSSILDKSSLHSGHIHVFYGYFKFHTLTTNAMEVSFYERFDGDVEFSMDRIVDIPFLKTNFMFPWTITDGSNTYVGLSTFIKKIIKRDKAVGTKYTFRFEDDDIMEEIFDTIEWKLRRICTKDIDGCLMIRMTDTKRIDIWYMWDDRRNPFKRQSLPVIFVIEVSENINS